MRGEVPMYVRVDASRIANTRVRHCVFDAFLSTEYVCDFMYHMRSDGLFDVRAARELRSTRPAQAPCLRTDAVSQLQYPVGTFR